MVQLIRVASRRCFHSSARLAKNPYYIYDLFKQQPLPAQQEVVDYGTHQMFDPSVTMPEETMKERVKKVFGSLGSREESRREALAKSVTVGGITVPAKPEEPTNCCMSGCVNCVWELYKDEIEEWREKVKEARQVLLKPENKDKPWPIQLGAPPANRHVVGEPESTQDEFDDGLDESIRVFIETEKRLHARRKARTAAKPTNLSKQATTS